MTSQIHYVEAREIEGKKPGGVLIGNHYGNSKCQVAILVVKGKERENRIIKGEK